MAISVPLRHELKFFINPVEVVNYTIIINKVLNIECYKFKTELCKIRNYVCLNFFAE